MILFLHFSMYLKLAPSVALVCLKCFSSVLIDQASVLFWA